MSENQRIVKTCIYVKRVEIVFLVGGGGQLSGVGISKRDELWSKTGELNGPEKRGLTSRKREWNAKEEKGDSGIEFKESRRERERGKKASIYFLDLDNKKHLTFLENRNKFLFSFFLFQIFFFCSLKSHFLKIDIIIICQLVNFSKHDINIPLCKLCSK